MPLAGCRCRAGVVGIAIFQIITGVVCFFAVQLYLNPESSAIQPPHGRPCCSNCMPSCLPDGDACLQLPFRSQRSAPSTPAQPTSSWHSLTNYWRVACTTSTWCMQA